MVDLAFPLAGEAPHSLKNGRRILLSLFFQKARLVSVFSRQPGKSYSPSFYVARTAIYRSPLAYSFVRRSPVMPRLGATMHRCDHGLPLRGVALCVCRKYAAGLKRILLEARRGVSEQLRKAYIV